VFGSANDGGAFGMAVSGKKMKVPFSLFFFFFMYLTWVFILNGYGKMVIERKIQVLAF
jgi:hypothetical protein